MWPLHPAQPRPIHTLGSPNSCPLAILLAWESAHLHHGLPSAEQTWGERPRQAMEEAQSLLGREFLSLKGETHIN